MSKLFDPKFASKMNTMETYKQMSKIYMASNDKNKAYDSIDQIKWKNTLLAHMPMSRLNDLLINYNNLDTQIDDKNIKRTRETLQSTKWAPILYNTYLDKSKRNFEYDFIHTDNASINPNKEEEEERLEQLQEINQGIEQASLRWAEQCNKMFLNNHVLLANTRELQDTKNRTMSTNKDNKDAKPIEKANNKSIKYNLKTGKEGTMQTDEKKVSEKIKYSTFHLSAYKIMNYLKQRILPKDKHIYKISQHSLFNPMLQKINTRLALPIRDLDTSLNKLNYWSRFELWYINMTKNKSNCPLKHNILRYDIWLHLCYLMKRYKIRTLKCIFNESSYVNQIDYGRIIWKNKANILYFRYKILMKNYNAARSLSLINFRSLGKLHKKTKFELKKIFDPPPKKITNEFKLCNCPI